MRKLILGMTVTTDGFVCGPNHEADWFMRTKDNAAKERLAGFLWQAGTHIMGRNTFEVIAPWWSTSNDILAEPMNKIEKVVFSKSGFVNNFRADEQAEHLSPYASTWSDAVVANDLVADINKLKQKAGEPILAHGGAGFAQELVKNGLVDEFRLSIHPVLIGKGISVFGEIPALIDLKLKCSEAFDSGIIINVYEVKK